MGDDKRERRRDEDEAQENEEQAQKRFDRALRKLLRAPQKDEEERGSRDSDGEDGKRQH